MIYCCNDETFSYNAKLNMLWALHSRNKKCFQSCLIADDIIFFIFLNFDRFECRCNVCPTVWSINKAQHNNVHNFIYSVYFVLCFKLYLKFNFVYPLVKHLSATLLAWMAWLHLPRITSASLWYCICVHTFPRLQKQSRTDHQNLCNNDKVHQIFRTILFLGYELNQLEFF